MGNKGLGIRGWGSGMTYFALDIVHCVLVLRIAYWILRIAYWCCALMIGTGMRNESSVIVNQHIS